MSSLPQPVAGGSLEDLRGFVNVRDDSDWRLLVSWLIAALRPTGPYPVLILHGEQGSAKSTLVRVLRALVDPNEAALRTTPRDERDLMIAGTNSWCIALDNMSRLPDWLSDALCRIATGGGFATRELYTDAEEAIFNAQRPIVMNGIEELATRGDLLDRAILLYLPSISEDKRRHEADFWRDFEQARPRILGTLLDVVSAALRNQLSGKLDRLPRMADFAVWACAAAPACGWTAEDAFPHLTTTRGRQNAIYAVWALDCLKGDPRYRWLCGDFTGRDTLRWSDFQDKHTWKPTIFAALGRVGFPRSPARMKALAARICAMKPSTREALVLLRRWQSGNEQGTVDG